jgi:hypothetical protein
MHRIALIALGLVVAGTAAAAPNTANDQSQPQTNSQGAAIHQSIAQQVRKNLEDAGYSDVQLMPSSFLVKAKDKDGNPVMMVISPDSVTVVSEVHSSQAGQSGSNGKSSNTSSDANQ